MLLAVNAYQQSIHLCPRLLYAWVTDFDNVETLQLVTHGLQRFVYYEVNPMTRARQFLGAVGWIFFVYLMAGLAAFGSADAPQIYAEFSLASWAPPATVFGPVWTLLYTMMAFSAWLIWRDHGFASAQNWFLLLRATYDQCILVMVFLCLAFWLLCVCKYSDADRFAISHDCACMAI